MISKQVEGIIYIACHCRELKCIPEKFPIPITIAYSFVKSDKFSSCDKCIYNEICYRNEKDFVYLKEGEKNA